MGGVFSILNKYGRNVADIFATDDDRGGALGILNNAMEPVALIDVTKDGAGRLNTFNAKGEVTSTTPTP